MNLEYSSWNDEASIITNEFSFGIKSNIGLPIFPPKLVLILFFFKTCSIILQVVDFPFVPVTTIDFRFGLNK